MKMLTIKDVRTLYLEEGVSLFFRTYYPDDPEIIGVKGIDDGISKYPGESCGEIILFLPCCDSLSDLYITIIHELIHKRDFILLDFDTYNLSNKAWEEYDLRVQEEAEISFHRNRSGLVGYLDFVFRVSERLRQLRWDFK